MPTHHDSFTTPLLYVCMIDKENNNREKIKKTHITAWFQYTQSGVEAEHTSHAYIHVHTAQCSRLITMQKCLALYLPLPLWWGGQERGDEKEDANHLTFSVSWSFPQSSKQNKGEQRENGTRGVWAHTAHEYGHVSVHTHTLRPKMVNSK